MLRHTLLLLAALVVASCSLPATSQTILANAREASLQLAVQRPDGTFHNFCSAVAIAPNHLATAQHCAVTFAHQMVYIGPKKYSGPRKLVLQDDGDTAIFWTEHTWEHYTPMARRAPRDYERVFQWGFPASLNSELYREGVFAGVWYSDSRAFDGVAGRTAWLFDLVSGRGDSGSGIFTHKGEVMCILSFAIHPPGDGLHLIGCYVPLFSDKQWELVYGR